MHNPYSPYCYLLEHYKASLTLERGDGHCEHKAVLLAALCRAIGIPARLGFVDIRDHLLSPKFRAMIGGGNLIVQHGYVEMHINGKWVHACCSYDLETCRKGGFVPVEFDGVHDARDSAFNIEGKPHIEYVKDHGTFEDFPFDWIMSYRQEWIAQMGREFNEFVNHVKRHQAG
jgi:hypothetical protein